MFWNYYLHVALLYMNLSNTLIFIASIQYYHIQPEYKLKWDDECKIEDGRIRVSFSISSEADFDEEVMEVLEMMEDEIASQEIIFQCVME